MSLDIIGVIHSGILVGQEVHTFFDGIKSAEHELSSTTEFLRSVRGSLHAIEASLSEDDLRNDSVIGEVKRNILLVRHHASALEAEVAKLGPGVEPAASSSEDAAIWSGMSRRKKASYSMRRTKIKELTEKLLGLSAYLQCSLLIYQLALQRQNDTEKKLAESRMLVEIEQLQPRSYVSYQDNRCLLTSSALAGTATADAGASKEVATRPSSDLSLYMDDSMVPMQKPCACLGRRQTVRSHETWLCFTYITVETKSVAHDKGCIYGEIHPVQSKWRMDITTQSHNLWKYFPIGMALTLSRSTSYLYPLMRISPPRLLNQIDMSSSRLGRLIKSIYLVDQVNWHDPKMKIRALEYWSRSIFKLFLDGKASTSDVDFRTGNTIFHHLGERFWADMGPFWAHTWAALSQIEFSKDSLLCGGFTPWEHRFVNAPWDVDTVPLFCTNLPWMDIPEIQDSLLTGWWVEGSQPHHLQAFTLVLTIDKKRELLQTSWIGPLCQAVILRSESKVAQILEAGISTWNEPFLSEATDIRARDLAAMWFPEIVSVTIRQTFDSETRLDLFRLSSSPPSQYPLVELAFNIGWKHGRTHGKASEDAYQDLIQLALDTDYPIAFDMLERLDDDAIAPVIINHLANRRQRLREHAIRYLSKAESDALELFDARLIDERHVEVNQALERRGIDVPNALTSYRRPWSEGRSVYRNAWHSATLSEALGNAGFDPERFIRIEGSSRHFFHACLQETALWRHDIFFWLSKVVVGSESSFKSNGIHLNLAPHRDCGGNDWDDTPGVSQCTSEKDHVLWCRLSFVHALMALLGHSIHRWDRRMHMSPDFTLGPNGVLTILRESLLISNEDNCICACSVAGCTPLHTFLKVLIFDLTGEWSFSHVRDVHDDLLRSAEILQALLERLQAPRSITMQFLRLYAFTSLGYQHTCCATAMEHLPGRLRRVYPSRSARFAPWTNLNDPKAMREEDSDTSEDPETLESLEEVMDQLGDRNEQHKGMELVAFVETEFIPVLERALAERQAVRLGQEDAREVEELVVKWKPPLVGPSPIHEEKPIDGVETEVIPPASLMVLKTDEERLRAIKQHVDNVCK